MNEIQIFEKPEFGQIRGAIIDGSPWFVGKDVADILGYQNKNRDIIRHIDEEDRVQSSEKLNTKMVSSLGQRGGWLINESGLYSLILSSKLPRAKEFKRWVTSEVLPSLRKNGTYTINEVPEEEMDEGDKQLLALATTVMTITKRQIQQHVVLKRLQKKHDKLEIQHKRLEESCRQKEIEDEEFKSAIVKRIDNKYEYKHEEAGALDARRLAERYHIYSKEGKPHSQLMFAIIWELRIPFRTTGEFDGEFSQTLYRLSEDGERESWKPYLKEPGIRRLDDFVRNGLRRYVHEATYKRKSGNHKAGDHHHWYMSFPEQVGGKEWTFIQRQQNLSSEYRLYEELDDE